METRFGRRMGRDCGWVVEGDNEAANRSPGPGEKKDGGDLLSWRGKDDAEGARTGDGEKGLYITQLERWLDLRLRCFKWRKLAYTKKFAFNKIWSQAHSIINW